MYNIFKLSSLSDYIQFQYVVLIALYIVIYATSLLD